MALTAQPTSALRTGGWENEIVPSLRKRLEKESRMLSKRMSHSSMSDDGNDPHTQSFDTTGRGSTSSHPRPSGIPRPSFQSRSPDPSQHYDSHPQPQPPPSVQKRPRTYSQPYPYDPADDPRADSPAAAANGGTPRPSDLKPTRIPQRARSPSIASHSHSGGTGWSAAGTTLNGHPNGHHDYTAADLWEQQKPQPSPTVPDVMLQRKNSEIMREQAPFNKYGSAASRETIEQVPFFPRSRDSYESEERPFEHWYRGDTARNGGVGELRVGRRQEMLEIANYGHALRERPSFSRGPTPTNVYHAENGYLHGGKRRRADSLGARESFYMEDHDEARHRSVLDEAPLTDVEVDGSDGDTLGAPGSDTEAEIIQTYSYTNHEPLSMPAAAASSPSLITHPTSSIPTPSPGPKKSSESAKPSVPSVKSQPTSLPKSPKKAPKSRNVTPTAPKPGAKKPTLHVQTASSSSAGSAIPPRVRAKSAASPLNTPTRGRGRGGKSPSTPRKTAASPKTPKPASATVAAAAKHRSVGVYPALADTGDDSLADAIPTWTQPKVKGDWDDVVLPAVAKKQGMQEQYEMADGSPKPKPVKTVIEPAPGTFGFDYSKFKPPRDYNPEQIPMDEFGKQTVDFDSPSTDTPSSPTPPAPTQQTSYPPQPKPPAQQQPAPRRPMSPRSESPLAFALYGELPQQQQEQPQPMEQPPQTGKPPTQAIPPPEREEEAGCCAKCVIM